MNFRYPVYNPHISVLNVAKDWYFEHSTTDICLALVQPYKVAAVRVLFDDPSIYSYDPHTANIDLSEFDLVVLSDAEYVKAEHITTWISHKGIKHWVLAQGGKHPDDTDSTRIIYRPYWLRRFLDINQYQETSAVNKPFLFESLMGSRRPHRDYVLMAATQSGLDQHSIITYRDVFAGNVTDGQTREFAAVFPETEVNWPYISPNLEHEWEVAPNVDHTMSFISPVEIYRRCRYSIVTETLGCGEQFFFSEKTMKVLFNKRVFVMISNHKFLHQLKQLGFRTFDNIIDETYDIKRIDSQRFKLAMHQVHALSWKNPDQVYHQTRDILDHNHNHLYRLVETIKSDMLQLLHNTIPTQHWS